MKGLKNKIRIVIIFCLASINLISQTTKTPPLEREITLIANNSSVQDILQNISQQAGFVFSYNPDEINANTITSIKIIQKPVRQVLNEIFAGSVKFKERGKYVILQKNQLLSEAGYDTKMPFLIEGYVTEANSGRKLNEATVYDKDLMVSAITDQYGYFKLEIPAGREAPELRISKFGYSDTLIIKSKSKTNFLNVQLVSNALNDIKGSFINAYITISDSVRLDKPIYPGWLISKKLKINTFNLKDTLFRNFQISLFPFLSTNRLLSGNTVNNVSVNLTVGYVQGIRKLELGGIMNIVRDSAKYCQMAGIGNIVGGSFKGFQAAGVYNLVKSLHGMQAAGVMNICRDNSGFCQLAGVGNIVNGDFRGFQAAGAINTAEFLRGMQVGGVLNIVKNDARKFQIAGVGNITGGSFSGLQMAGVYNYAKMASGLQIGGVFNFTRDMNGFQISGAINRAKNLNGIQLSGAINISEMLNGIQLSGAINQVKIINGVQMTGFINNARVINGLQISGFLNRAGYFHGFQLGWLNVSDSCKGTPVGFISFVKKGYHKIEISADELLFTNLAFKTGVKHFHNNFLIGIRPSAFEDPLWTFGYGLGTTFGKGDKWQYDIDLSTQNVIKGNDFVFNSTLYKAYFGIERKLAPKISLAIGLTYNFLLSDSNTDQYNQTYSKLPPFTFSDKDYRNDRNLKAWPGAKIALRFL